jgi:hypothetical protein
MIVSFQAALAVVLSEQLEAKKAAAASQDPHSPFFTEYGFRLNHLLVRDLNFTYGKQGTQSHSSKRLHISCNRSDQTL